MTLLIVNDEVVVADTMKAEIAWAEYGIDTVCVAYDACSAKEIIQGHDIDIMLCDIEMPRENGLALLRWIRGQGREIECIFLTCHAEFSYAQEAIGLRCQDYILTPAKYEDIGATIRRVVERIRSQKEERLYIEYGKYTLKEKEQKNQESVGMRPEPGQVVEEIAGYVIRNLSDFELNVESIASHFHFHPVYLNRIFRREKSISIGQFIINERMKMAAILLREGRHTVNEVAEMVGYAHYSNFYNMFKKTYKISALRYIEEHLKRQEP